MAAWDSADLLQHFNDEALRPANEMAAQAWIDRVYRLMTKAQQEWLTHIASVAPRSNYCPPRLMVSTDGGYTYEFRDGGGALVFPTGHAEIRATKGGLLLAPCVIDGGPGDYILEGNRIRIPNGQARAFTGGPYAQFVEPGGTINATTQPTLQPPQARILIVYRALRKWASRGGMRDPQAYLDMENEAWLGNPSAGVHGLLGMLKTQQALEGMAAQPDPNAWWRGNPDLGRDWR